MSRSALSVRVLLWAFLFVVVAPFLPLLISGRWGWWEAWVYAIVCILGFAISRALAGRRHPGLLAERGRMLRHDDAKPWDKTLAPLVGLGGALLPLVAGLDARFGWSAGFSLPVELAALILIIGGYALSSYALVENAFFSGMVRIQTDRGHRVISSGPYRWLRHPGYAGALLAYVATPLFLDSAWTFLPAALLTAVLVIRTGLEDRTLQAELDGYRAYAGRVQYRLLPGVW
ncbi:MAG: isoprenylcysteine carboxylmethyltransferase family protein [Chloroflexi bacterium]|nr:isoprenylcysteine carboxylmethyltransferase family protein [Chloroflexota bacterium]